MQLIAQNLAASLNGTILFSGLNFSLKAGQFMTITGANGAGKTTLLRMIAQIYPIESGLLYQIVQEKASSPLSIACHYFGHEYAMKGDLPVGDNLRFWGRWMQLPDIEIEKRLVDLLKQTGLLALISLPFAILSAGQKKRIAFIRLLLQSRPLWLLDEPTTGMDGRSQNLLTYFMQQHLDQGGMIITATHHSLNIVADLSLCLEDYKTEKPK